MRDVEERAERVLAGTPGYVWDGETLPVPVEDLADSVYGLLVRDVEDMRSAPGAPALEAGQSLYGMLLPARGEIWAMPRRRVSGRRAGASRSATSWATGSCTARARSR